jgi:hypothetical protein
MGHGGEAERSEQREVNSEQRAERFFRSYLPILVIPNFKF